MPARLVTSAYRYLMASGVPAALVTEGLLGADPTGGAYATGWVFSGDLTGDPYRAVEGSGKCAIVLYHVDHWAPATAQHSARYPRLTLNVFADVSRATGGNPTQHDAERKAEMIFERINPLFHDNRNVVRAFDDLRVVSTLQGSGYSLMQVPNGDGVVRGNVSYDVTLG